MPYHSHLPGGGEAHLVDNIKIKKTNLTCATGDDHIAQPIYSRMYASMNALPDCVSMHGLPYLPGQRLEELPFEDTNHCLHDKCLVTDASTQNGLLPAKSASRLLGTNPDEYHLPTPRVEEIPGHTPDDSTTSGIMNSGSQPSPALQHLFPDEAIWRASTLIENLWPAPTLSAEQSHPVFC